MSDSHFKPKPQGILEMTRARTGGTQGLSAPREFGDFVTAGLALVKSRDTNAWALGDIAVDFVDAFPVHPGRPVDPDQPTLSDLAAGWDVVTPRVSEWHSVAAFYAPNVRTFEDLSWAHYNAARRASGNDIENALELLADAQSKAMGINAFKRYLAGEFFEGEVAYDRLPPEIQAVVPRGKKLWVVITEKHE